MQIREDIKRGVYLEGLAEVGVQSRSDALDILAKGLANRHTGATSMNLESSRSHSVFTLKVSSQSTHMGVCKVRHSQFHFVDLAGSERQKKTETTGERLKEGCNINKSLSVLGSVINALVESAAGKKTHVRYRDSKLTFLLRDSLGGNSKTAMVANISPAPSAYHETLSTLQFAQRAKLIKTHALLNEDMAGAREALQQEIRRLKEELAVARIALNDNQRSAAGPANCKPETSSHEEDKLRQALETSMSALMETNAHLQCEVEKKVEILKSVENCFSVMQARELQYRTALKLQIEQESRSGIEQSARVIDTYDYKTISENLILKERLWRLEQVRPQFELAHSLCFSAGITSKPYFGDFNSKQLSSLASFDQPDPAFPVKEINYDKSSGIKNSNFGKKSDTFKAENHQQHSETVYKLPPDIEAEIEGMRLDLIQSDEEKESLLSSLDYLKEALEKQANSHAEERARLHHEIELLKASATAKQANFDLIQQLEQAKSESKLLASKAESASKLAADLRQQLELSQTAADHQAKQLYDLTSHNDLLLASLSKATEEISLQKAQLQNEIENRKNLENSNSELQTRVSLMNVEIERTKKSLKDTTIELQLSENQVKNLEIDAANQLATIKQKENDLYLMQSFLQKQQAINAELENRLARSYHDRNISILQFDSLQNALNLMKDSLESNETQAVFTDLLATTSIKQQARLMKKALCDRENLLFSTRYEIEKVKTSFRCQFQELVSDLHSLELDYRSLRKTIQLNNPVTVKVCESFEKDQVLDAERNTFEGLGRQETQNSFFLSNIFRFTDGYDEDKNRLFKPNKMALNRSKCTAAIASQSKDQVLAIDTPKKQTNEKSNKKTRNRLNSGIENTHKGLNFETLSQDHHEKLNLTLKKDAIDRQLLGKRQEEVKITETSMIEYRSGGKRSTSEYSML